MSCQRSCVSSTVLLCLMISGFVPLTCASIELVGGNVSSVSSVYSYPVRNHTFVPINSRESVFFCCYVEEGSLALWELSGTQLQNITDAHNSSLARDGVLVYSDTNYTTISINQTARHKLGESFPLQCVSKSSQRFSSKKGQKHIIVFFGKPEPPEGLKLIPYDYDLVLEWKWPHNVPEGVEVNYTVQVIRVDDGAVVMENTTFDLELSLRSFEEQVIAAGGECEMYHFTVQASNDAGLGSPSDPIMDTIPAFPDSRNISRDLIVEEVNLEPFTVTVSFPPLNSCSVNISLHNYTIKVNEAEVIEISADEKLSNDGKIRRKLNETNLPGVTLAASYMVAVTTCTNVTCRTSDPVIFNSTTVQRVDLMYYENNIYLQCSFAINGKAQGCSFRFLLNGSNETEEYVIIREAEGMSGQQCNKTKNQLKVYSKIEVSDYGDLDGRGNISLTVVPRKISTIEEYEQKTGCELASALSNREPKLDIVGISAGVVAGVVVIIITGIIFIIVTFIRCRSKNRKTLAGRSQNVNFTCTVAVNGAKCKSDSTSGGEDQPDGVQMSESTNNQEPKWFTCEPSGVVTINLKELARFRANKYKQLEDSNLDIVLE